MLKLIAEVESQPEFEQSDKQTLPKCFTHSKKNSRCRLKRIQLAADKRHTDTWPNVKYTILFGLKYSKIYLCTTYKPESVPMKTLKELIFKLLAHEEFRIAPQTTEGRLASY